MLALHNSLHFGCVNYIEIRQKQVELVVVSTSFALVKCFSQTFLVCVQVIFCYRHTVDICSKYTCDVRTKEHTGRARNTDKLTHYRVQFSTILKRSIHGAYNDTVEDSKQLPVAKAAKGSHNRRNTNSIDDVISCFALLFSLNLHHST
jgi:hypothetical protein